MLRRIIQQSKGEGTAPAWCWYSRRRSSTAPASRTATAPPVTSLWPARNLVVECITRSAPSASGCCSTGVAKVLSQASSAPRARASSAAPAMSAMRSRGLEGVSIHSMRVAGVQASLSASRSQVSARVTPTPIVSTSRRSWRRVP